VEGGEEWWRSGWRNRGVEGRVKGVVEEELVDGVVEWREERSCGGADGGIEE
jgi:hypothetical protein